MGVEGADSAHLLSREVVQTGAGSEELLRYPAEVTRNKSCRCHPLSPPEATSTASLDTRAPGSGDLIPLMLLPPRCLQPVLVPKSWTLLSGSTQVTLIAVSGAQSPGCWRAAFRLPR